MQRALKEHKAQLQKPIGKRLSIAVIAARHEVPNKTLGHCLGGQRSVAQWSKEKQKLNEWEDILLAAWILESPNEAESPTSAQAGKDAS